MSKLYILFITLLFINGCGDEGRVIPRKLSDTDLYVDIKNSDTNQSIDNEDDENESNPTINPIDDNNDEPCYIDSNSDNNSNNGNDNNTTPNWPSDDNKFNAKKLRTISQAIKIAEKEDISAIHIAEGNYTEENGEEFPIVVPKGLTLLSDSANAVVNIIGAGETDSGNLATIVFTGDNRNKKYKYII